MLNEEEVKQCPNCRTTIEYGFSHQCYSNIYSKLFNSVCITKDMDLDGLEERLKAMKDDLIQIRDSKREHLKKLQNEESKNTKK